MSVIKVKLITKTNCPFCDKAKALLRESGIEFSTQDVTDNEKYCALMKQKGWTVPRVWVGDKFIGGYSDLCDYLIEEGLVRL